LHGGLTAYISLTVKSTFLTGIVSVYLFSVVTTRYCLVVSISINGLKLLKG